MKNYSLQNMACMFAGIPLKSQFAKDNPITIEYDEDSYDLEMSADGTGTRYDLNNRAATITIKLLQSSDDNAKLAIIHAADGPDGAGIGPFGLADMKGTSKFAAKHAFIMGPPKTIPYGQKVEMREWKIRTDELIHFVGGN